MVLLDFLGCLQYSNVHVHAWMSRGICRSRAIIRARHELTRRVPRSIYSIPPRCFLFTLLSCQQRLIRRHDSINRPLNRMPNHLRRTANAAFPESNTVEMDGDISKSSVRQPLAMPFSSAHFQYTSGAFHGRDIG